MSHGLLYYSLQKIAKYFYVKTDFFLRFFVSSNIKQTNTNMATDEMAFKFDLHNEMSNLKCIEIEMYRFASLECEVTFV